ncbi:MAG TPA: hypothetical protein VN457_00275, partial [Chlamydiales bacterium]|nr:hypothetical protein [Chlamydiales bacterium]
MNTDTYVDQFRAHEMQRYESEQGTEALFHHVVNGIPTALTTSEMLVGIVQRFVHDHSTFVTIAEVFGIVLGIGLVALASTWEMGVVKVLTWVLGTAIAIISAIAYFALGLAVPSNHDMADHAFQPGSYGVGKLYYQGDL